MWRVLDIRKRRYHYAVSIGKPVIGFLHQDPGSIPAKHTDPDEELRKKLALFRSKVQKKMVRYWTTPDELGTVVSMSYIRLMKTHPAEGWVKARHAKTTEDAEKTARLLEHTQVLEKEISTLRLSTMHETASLAQGRDSVVIKCVLRAQSEECFVSFLYLWGA